MTQPISFRRQIEIRRRSPRPLVGPAAAVVTKIIITKFEMDEDTKRLTQMRSVLQLQSGKMLAHNMGDEGTGEIGCIIIHTNDRIVLVPRGGRVEISAV